MFTFTDDGRVLVRGSANIYCNVCWGFSESPGANEKQSLASGEM